MTLTCGQHQISLEDVEESDNISADRTLCIDDHGDIGRYRPNTSILIVSQGNERATRTTIHVLGWGAPSRIGGRDAVCVQNNLMVIVGSFVICLSPDLQTLLWQRRCDFASCFGIYMLPSEQELIVHGECDITKLTANGEIVWQASGRDIFTGPFSLTSDAVFATDFYGAKYELRLADGDITELSRDIQS